MDTQAADTDVANTDIVDTDVVIVGAGAAGLAAAHTLREAGIDITVVEARSRVGGRIYTYRDPRVPVPIELGAEFLHGDTPETTAILREAGVAAYEVMGDHWRADVGAFSDADEFWERIGRVFQKLEVDDTDRAFLDALHAQPTDKPKRLRDRQMAREFVEGFHAADPARISARALKDEALDESALSRSGRVAGGYDRVTAWLAQQVYDAISLNTVVERVSWTSGRVEIDAVRGPDYARTRIVARRAIVTVPISLLQASADAPQTTGTGPIMGPITFAPTLPETHQQALSCLGMGTVVRVVLAFRTPFWETLPNPPKGCEAWQLSFLHGTGTDIPVWWTLFPMRTGVIVGWAGGPAAATLARNESDEIISRALSALARHVGRPAEVLGDLLDGAWTHNWTRDPYARGAYSYPLVGGAEAGEALAVPIEQTLYIAGEATVSGGMSGTGHRIGTRATDAPYGDTVGDARRDAIDGRGVKLGGST